MCWLLKHARAVVDQDEEAASSNRASYEARHTPRAAAVARTGRGDCSQPGSDSAAQRRSRAIRLAVRLVRETAPKGARMFTANDMTSTCKAQSSQLAPSLAARHLQGGSRGAPISRTCSKRPPTVARSPKHGELHVAFRNDVACVEHETLQPKPLKSRIPVRENGAVDRKSASRWVDGACSSGQGEPRSALALLLFSVALIRLVRARRGASCLARRARALPAN